MKLIFFMTVILSIFSVGYGHTLRVPSEYPTIQEAIYAASADTLILVAPGTYTEQIDYLAKRITIRSENGALETVIEGDGTGCVVTFNGNSGHESVLEGFTLTNGINNSSGGGIFCENAHASLINNIISFNSASNYGGGLHCHHSDLTLIENTFYGNVAGRNGGGVFMGSGSVAIVEDNVFMDNTADYGGGAWFGGDEGSTFTRNTVKNNWATVSGGGVYLNGWSTFADNTIVNNFADEGGGIYHSTTATSLERNIIKENLAVYGGGVFVSSLNRPNMAANTIELNQAVYGGGIYLWRAYPINVTWPRITQNIIRHNAASSTGGGIYCLESNPILTDNLFYSNNAQWGGGIYFVDSVVALTNNTITNNVAHSEGGGIYCALGSESKVTNCILWGNTGLAGLEIYDETSGSIDVKYCDVKGGYSGQGNIDADPLFADPLGEACQLSHSSPCIDAGTNSAFKIPLIDFDDDIRVADGNGDGVACVDMGMDELLTFRADKASIPESTGDVIQFSLDAGPGHGGRTYLVLGSISGTSPGEPLPGGYVTMPLNFDYFTSMIMIYLNTTLFDNFLGTLDATGQGWAMLDATGAIPPGAAGHVMAFSYAMNNPFDFVGNLISVEIVP